MHIYISTGEVSGEQHAAGLTRACARLCPDTRFTAMGSGILREAGVEIAVDSSRIKVMGFVAIVRHLPAIWEAFRQALHHVEETRPDAVVLVALCVIPAVFLWKHGSGITMLGIAGVALAETAVSLWLLFRQAEKHAVLRI